MFPYFLSSQFKCSLFLNMHTMTDKHTKHSHHAWEMQNSQARVQPTEDLLKLSVMCHRPLAMCHSSPVITSPSPGTPSSRQPSAKPTKNGCHNRILINYIWMHIRSSEIINCCEVFPFYRKIDKFIVFHCKLFFFGHKGSEIAYKMFTKGF